MGTQGNDVAAPSQLERVLAAIAHGAIGFGFLGIGFLLSLAISGGLWLASLRRPYLRQQADRAGLYQLVVLLANVAIAVTWGAGLGLLIYLGGWEGWMGGGLRAIAWGLLALVLALALPFFVAWYAGTIVYGLYAATRALAGADWRYRRPKFGSRRGSWRAT